MRCLLLFGLLIAAVIGTNIDTSPDAYENGISASSDQITHIFVANITLLDPHVESSNVRQEEELKHLQHRLARNTGVWNPSHPGYRLLSALHGFYRYKERNMVEVNKWREWYRNVPKRQRKMVESVIHYTRKLNMVEHLLDANEVLADDILHHGLKFYGVEMDELQSFMKEAEADGKTADRTSIAQAMKHFVRDWAEEGIHERAAFTPILETLFDMKRDNKELKVLLPGAGLGRLAHEIDGLGGYEVTMNEWSSYMNLVYRYLETIHKQNSVSYHPYIDWWSHHATTIDMQRSVSFPERTLNPSVLLVEGDFITIFQDTSNGYDVIITLFFIDTARNLIAYLENIHRLLRPGGTWINLGPLLYGSAPFLQLSLDEIIAVSERIGFEFMDTKDEYGNITIPGMKVRSMDVPYGMNSRGLSRNAYLAQFWVATKMLVN